MKIKKIFIFFLLAVFFTGVIWYYKISAEKSDKFYIKTDCKKIQYAMQRMFCHSLSAWRKANGKGSANNKEDFINGWFYGFLTYDTFFSKEDFELKNENKSFIHGYNAFKNSRENVFNYYLKNSKNAVYALHQKVINKYLQKFKILTFPSYDKYFKGYITASLLTLKTPHELDRLVNKARIGDYKNIIARQLLGVEPRLDFYGRGFIDGVSDTVAVLSRQLPKNKGQ